MNTLSDKALARGVASLSDEELLSLLLGVECGGGSGRDLSAAVLDACRGSLATLASCDVSRLRMIAGMGLRRAERLKAAVELGAAWLPSAAAMSSTSRRATTSSA